MADDPDTEFVSLYRRFRPGRFAELRGQPHVVRALQGAVRDGRVAHAYLFSGPRGTGKTSTARILARTLNCATPLDGEPCGVCASCAEIARGTSLDVHELDAASNNGVDAMRDLIAHAALATPGRWKVYIVDEVHMLSTAAANALLKTLEEPPGHVVFVLATTDPQKVPPTIRSRTQHFEFGLLGTDTLTGLLREVRDAAGLAVEEDALSAAVRKGKGSARDALSALDQVVASGTTEVLRPEVAGLTEAIADEDVRGTLVAVAELHEAGWGPQQLATELVDELRQMFLVALAPELCAVLGAERDRLVAQASRMGLPRVVRSIESLGRAQVDMREAPDPRAVLEVALVRLARAELDDSAAAILDRLAHLEQAVATGATVLPTTTTQTTAHGAPHRAAATTPAQPAGTPHLPQSEGAHEAGPAPPAPEVSDRPALGALRRPRNGAPASPPTPAVHDAPRQPQPAMPATAPPPGAAATAPPDRDEIVQAWGDHVLRGLSARAKVLYSAGRFVAMEGGVATFALPNATHRDKCEDVRGTVEAALTSHFGTPVGLRLSVDEGDVQMADAPGAFGLDPDDDFDPEAPGEAVGSIESAAQARLLEVFPGAEEVTG